MYKSKLTPVYAHLHKLVSKGSLDIGKKKKLVDALKQLNHAIVTKNHNKAEKAINNFCKELIKD